MKPLFETCETCQGTGMIKVDIFGETYPIDQKSVWNEEAQECTRLDHDPSDRALLSQASSITFSLGISGVHALAAEANRP